MNRIELVGRARHPSAAGHIRTRHYGTEQLGAGRVLKREERAPKAVHETEAGGIIGEGTLNLIIADIVGDVCEDFVRRLSFSKCFVRHGRINPIVSDACAVTSALRHFSIF